MLDFYNQAVLNVTDACICIAGICWTKGGMISGKSMCTPGTKILPPIPGKLITLSSMKVSAAMLPTRSLSSTIKRLISHSL